MEAEYAEKYKDELADINGLNSLRAARKRRDFLVKHCSEERDDET